MFRLLLYGVCRTIKPSGPLDGLLGGRFILAFMVCTFISLSKGFTIGWIVLSSNGLVVGVQMNRVEAVGLVSALFLPQFIISLFSTIGLSINSLKTILYHPELLLLPSGIIYNLIILKVTKYLSSSCDLLIL